jgi:hypothetical protein
VNALICCMIPIYLYDPDRKGKEYGMESTLNGSDSLKLGYKKIVLGV